MARVFGLEVLHMADTDVLPYDYVTYGKEIGSYLNTAKTKASDAGVTLDFTAALAAAQKFSAAASAIREKQLASSGDAHLLNTALRAAEANLLSAAGLPNRPWFKHVVYAPGEYTGYAAVVIPGVNEALDAKDAERAKSQLAVLTDALLHAATTLEGAK